MCWVCPMMTPKPVRNSLEIWGNITWWLLCLSASTRLHLGLLAALATSQSSLTTDMVGNILGYLPRMSKIRYWAALQRPSANMDVCHRTMTLLLRLNQRRIKHSYLSHTLTMAFLLQHVTPLKLWVVGIVYLALALHIISFHVPLRLLFPTPCPASIAHSPYIILWILYCLSLARDTNEPYFSSES